MEELLPVINRLQSIFAITGTCYDIVQLPQIVVVGSQVCNNIFFNLI